MVAIQIRTLKNGKKAPDETRYLHQDALGNVDTITDSHAKIIQRISYDPFGKRTVTSGSDPDLKAWTARGFTGHEHLDNLGLVHMNARVYDPEIGRFISPDTYIQSPGMSQSYNRYVYVMNNPLKYTDPSGHFWQFIAGAMISYVAAQSDNKYIRAIGMAAGMALMGGAYGGSLFSTTGVGGMIGNGMAAGFVQGYATTGTLTGAFNGMVQGGISAGFAFGIGHGAGGNPLFGTGGTYLAHGVSQGIISKLRGGGFKSGFVGAIIGHASGGVTGGIGGGSSLAITLRTVIAAVFGGVATQATGGSFADGALSAAVTHLFNDEANNILNPMFHPHHAEFDTDMPTMELAVNATGIVGVVGGIRGILSWGRSLFRSSASTQCFVAGTLIHTRAGTKAIEDINVGDMVISRDETTGETGWKPVTQLFRNHDKTILNVTLADPKGKVETFGTTLEHPFHVEGKGWVLAGELQTGDLITGLEVGTSQTVQSVVQDAQSQDTYNFEVADYHTYFVGENGVWVHNTCGVYYHYTDALGAKGISETGLLMPNSKGQVFLTKELLSPDAVKNTLFLGNSGSKGSHVVEVILREGLPVTPGKNAYEFIYKGTIRAGRHADIKVSPNEF